MWFLPPAMDLLPKAEEAALKALDLNPELSEAHNAYGIVNLNKWNWKKAEKSYKKAIELNPNLSDNHVIYGCLLTYTGRLDEAKAEMGKALLLDPLSTGAVNNLGMVNITDHNYDEVIKITEDALKVFQIKELHTYLGQAYLYNGMFGKALETFKEQENEIWTGVTYAGMRDTDKALEILDNIEKKEDTAYVSPFLKSLLLFSLNQDEKGFAMLNHAYEIHDLELTEITTYPLLDRISSDPRYIDLLKKMGLR
jgi:tetratricopeptide (TPR) repeat protein